MENFRLVTICVTVICSSGLIYCQHIPNGKIDIIGLASLLTKADTYPVMGTPVKVTREKGYYPDFKQFGREEAVLEQEHWLSKIDSVYNRAQKKAADYLNLKPLVDTIQEHEKYGNTGDQHRSVAKALVNGFDAIGKKINNVVDIPSKTKNYAGKTINAALDAIGSKLVGI